MKFVKTIYKHGKTGNRAIDALWNILILLLSPVILAVGLVIIFFAALLSLGQRLTTSKKDRQIARANEKTSLEPLQQWSILASVNDLVIYRKFCGALPWDSGDYFNLYGDPEIPYLAYKPFGDWFYVEFNGVFLQRWSDTTATTCSLVFVDADSLQVIELLHHIPTRNWIVKKKDLNFLEFTFETLQSKSTYGVDLHEIDIKREVLNGSND